MRPSVSLIGMGAMAMACLAAFGGEGFSNESSDPHSLEASYREALQERAEPPPPPSADKGNPTTAPGRGGESECREYGVRKGMPRIFTGPRYNWDRVKYSDFGVSLDYHAPSLQVGFGAMLTDHLELAFAAGAGVMRSSDGDAFESGATHHFEVRPLWHFLPGRRIDPYAGVSMGVSAYHAVTDAAFVKAGPVAGINYFLTPRVSIFLEATHTFGREVLTQELDASLRSTTGMLGFSYYFGRKDAEASPPDRPGSPDNTANCIDREWGVHKGLTRFFSGVRLNLDRLEVGGSRDKREFRDESAQAGFGTMLTDHLELAFAAGGGIVRDTDSKQGHAEIRPVWHFLPGRRLDPYAGVTLGASAYRVRHDSLFLRAGPVAGLNYFLTPRVSVFLESSHTFGADVIKGSDTRASLQSTTGMLGFSYYFGRNKELAGLPDREKENADCDEDWGVRKGLRRFFVRNDYQHFQFNAFGSEFEAEAINGHAGFGAMLTDHFELAGTLGAGAFTGRDSGVYAIHYEIRPTWHFRPRHRIDPYLGARLGGFNLTRQPDLFASAGAFAGLNYYLTRRLSIYAEGGFAHSRLATGESRFEVRANAFTGGLGLSYTFGK